MSASTAGIVGLLLAAGYSRRFGADKLMQPLADGTPLALAAALNLRSVLPRMLAVVRADNAPLIALFSGQGIDTVIADRAGEGMSASLAQGVAATADAQGWLVALADMPAVQSATIARIAAALADGALIAAPGYRGRRGHPVGFAAKFGKELRELTGDEGARSLISACPGDVRLVECDDPGVLADIDVAADLSQVNAYRAT